MIYQSDNGIAKFSLPMLVSVCDELVDKIAVMEGVTACKLNYKSR